MGSKNLNILIVLPTAILGGAERVMFNLASHLADEGHDITIYAMSRGKQPGWESLEKKDNCKIFFKPFSSEKTSLPAFAWNIFKLSFSKKFDYVFSTHTHTNAILSLFKKTKILKCSRLIGRESTFIFERFHGPKRKIFYSLYKLFYGDHDLLICQTPKMLESLIENLGFYPAKKIATLPNPVNIKNISESTKSVPMKIPPKTQTIIACGRLIPLKGFHLLIESFSLVSINHPDAHLYIIGDGPERAALEFLTNKLNIQKKVTFIGRISNPIPWFKIADIGVISSEREGFPNVLIEMMASGAKHIISTPCSDGVLDIPEISILEKHDLQCLAEAIDKSLSSKIDRSATYMKYIKDHRSIEAFWENIKQTTLPNAA